ncbi:MAG: ral nucleoside transport system permease protein [Bacillota bacterium]|nr:ral nucleoside transport system permease protein [Bacillota bacterium]
MPKSGQGTKGPMERRTLLQREETRELFIPVVAVALALVLGAVLVKLGGKSPVAAYSALVRGAFGGVGNLAETLINVTPLIFTGLAVAFSFRCGLFNIGAEGQLIMGQVASAWVGFALTGLPAFVHMPLALVAGVAAGAAWGAVPGYLKARLGVHEVINTIMMNYIALYLSHYLVIGPLKAPGPLPVTPTIAPAARLWRFLPPTRLHLGVVLAVAAVWLVYYVLFRTTLGYEIRAVGQNPEAARYGGISVRRNIVLAMVISGGLAGAAGAVQVLGLQYKFLDIFSFTGYGFDGIAVALLGRNHPLGVLAAACLFGTLARGAILMQSIARIPKEIIGIVQATIVLFVAADEIIRRFIAPRRKAAPAAAAQAALNGVEGGADHGA